MITNTETAMPIKKYYDKAWYRIGICLLTFILLVSIAYMGVITMVWFGPSAAARDALILYIGDKSAVEILSERIRGGLGAVQNVR